MTIPRRRRLAVLIKIEVVVMVNDRTQKAGDNATQLQADKVNITVNNGISEERVRAIIDEKFQELIRTYSMEAHDVARHRIQEFAEILVPKLLRKELLESLRDPSIQTLLLEAEKTAASTERPPDLELLSELLIHRVQKGENRHIRAGISHAVKIVDEISDDALQGLTVVHTLTRFYPIAPKIEDGLEVLDNIFKKILYSPLPKGDEWIEHLDILNAVRIQPFGMKSIIETCVERMPGYIDIGIKKDSDSYSMVLDLMAAAGISSDRLVDHELRSGYVRLGISNINSASKIIANQKLVMRSDEKGQLYGLFQNEYFNDDQLKVLKEVYGLYEREKLKLQENKERFMEMWNRYGSLLIIGEWWQSINPAFNINAVGQVLAQANAKRVNPALPDLD